MTDERQAKLYQTQKSLTEWLEDIKHKDSRVIRAEDNDKRERLKFLKKTIGLPFDAPVKFEAIDLRDKNPKFLKYMKDHGDELCALRLIPKDSNLPKLRLRGETVRGVYGWFLEQNIAAEDYRAEYIPHSGSYRWSTIFVINKHGIHGEIIRGAHYQLTQGFFDSGKPVAFSYDFNKWELSRDDRAAKRHLASVIRYLQVSDKAKQEKIKKALGGEFSHGYLHGYFESIYSEEFGQWFVDYSQSLGKMYESFVIKRPSRVKGLVKGLAGSPGRAEGKVKIVNPGKTDVNFPVGGILVCAVTTPDFVPLMQKAAAIVTDQGGILSHAAIVARELKTPCIVAAGNATKVLKDGQQIVVDADKGTVSLA